MSRTTTQDRKCPRLFLPADLAAETSMELDRTQAHYLLDVLRKKVGDQVRLFNGREGEWRATITEAARRRCRLQVEDQRRAQDEEPGPALLFAPIKKARMEMLVEKATELGVGRLMPVKTRRSIVDRINPERLRAITVEAAEQCERLSVPEIGELTPLERALGNWPGDRPLYLADETGGGQPLLGTLQADLPAAFLVGPEGGFDPAELEQLGQHPAVVQVDLGSRILRAETAGMALLACWSARQSGIAETAV